jgi:hypothetical protein
MRWLLLNRQICILWEMNRKPKATVVDVAIGSFPIIFKNLASVPFLRNPTQCHFSLEPAVLCSAFAFTRFLEAPFIRAVTCPFSFLLPRSNEIGMAYRREPSKQRKYIQQPGVRTV